MRILILLHISLLMTSAAWLGDNRKWIIDSSSRLVIHGSTNVNKFVCSTDCYNRKDTLEYEENIRSCDIIFLKNEMIIPVESFSCGNEMITKDFWQTLNKRQHPYLKIEFISLNDSESLYQGNLVSGKVRITLAGVTKSFLVNYSVKRNARRNIFSLVGKQSVCFTDFQLKAPTKMMGLIQVQEDLDVEFQLHLIPV